MELHALWIVLLVVMTVDALSLRAIAFRTEYVVEDDALVIVLQTALTDGQVFIGDV